MDHTSMSDYMAHGFCFSWETGLVWLHVVSDIVTGLTYYLITAAICYFTYKRRDIPFMWVFLLFAMFIMACGTTHFFAAYTVYVPEYWGEGYVKAFTAIISVAAAVILIPKIPEAILMPSLAKTLEELQCLNAEQAANKVRLQCKLNVLQHDATNAQELLDYALNQALTMSNSKYGYIYYYNEDTHNFTLNSWSRDVMQACQVVNPQSLYELEKTGIWGEAVRQRKPIMVNDFTIPDPLQKGYPEGHVALTRFLTVPVIENNLIVAVVGVANKSEPYTDDDIMQLTLLMEAVWKVADRSRLLDELKQKNAELERFIYTISHDLKSPLVTVSAFLDYLEVDLQAGNKDKIAKDIGYMRGASNKMELMLAELLELARVGRLSDSPERIELNDLVQEALQMVAGSIAEKRVKVTVLGNSILLFAKRQRLLEIWQNLLENAVKYMGEQPLPQIEIGVEENNHAQLFFVRDNGMGIDSRYSENIFGLFNKLDASSEGSGLGLALVKRIVEMYGGKIWVESEGVGEGSCFKFTLPMALER